MYRVYSEEAQDLSVYSILTFILITLIVMLKMCMYNMGGNYDNYNGSGSLFQKS